MENASGIPHALSYSLNTMQGTSFNSFELAPSTGTSSVGANGQIRFMVPNNGLLDVKTSKVTFSVTTTASKGCRLPAHADTLFQRLEVKAGGVTIYSGSNFHGILENIKYNMGIKKACGVTGHKDFLDAGDAKGKFIGTANVSETYGEELGVASNMFAIDLGDFANIQPRLLSVDLLPSLEVILTLADNSVLSCVTSGILQRGAGSDITTVNSSASGAQFTVTNPRLYVNMYSLASGAYQNAIRSRMADVGYLSLCYDNNLCFNSEWTGSSRFSLSAMSLKRLTAVWRRKSASTISGAVPVAGGACADFDGDGGVYGILGSSGANNGGIAEYQGAVQQFSLPTSEPAHNVTSAAGASFHYDSANACDFQWKIQSAQVPQYFADVVQQAELTKHAYNVEEFGKAKIMPQYLFNYHAFSIPLELPTSPLDKKVISGLNSMSTNMFVELTSSGSNRDLSNYDVLIFATIDNILRVGEGKAIELLN